MAFVQTTYSNTMGKALPGMSADADFHADTRIVETSAGIGPGLAVSQGTSDKEAKIGAAAAAGFVGVSMRDISVENATSADVIPRYSNIAVLTEGDIWVTVGGDVVAGGDVTFAAATGVLSSAAASGSQFAVAGARWMTSASSGGLAILRLSGALPSA